MEGTQEGQISYLLGDVTVKCVRFIPVSLTAARGPGTVCTGAQPEPAQVKPLGAQSSQEGSQHYSPSQNQTQFTYPLCPREHRKGNSLLEKLERPLQKTRRSNQHGACYSAVTFTRTSADTRVGAIEHPQIQYPRISMDWVASPLRVTQSRPRFLQ